MAAGQLRIAAVQFPLSGEIDRNYHRMALWLERAAGEGAQLVQFSETALTGYHRVHLDDPQAIDRELLAARNRDLRQLAAGLGVWLVYGSTHFAEPDALPFNCLYAVGPQGRELCRYDKVFLTDTDAQAYRPGNALKVLRIGSFRVGLTICFDMRFPEIFRRYLQAGVNLVLISSYQCRGPRAGHMRLVAPANLVTRAAENGIWLSAANASDAPAWHESMIVRFNGQVLARARRHRASLAIATLDSSDFEPFTDFIRRQALRALEGRHPLTGCPLLERLDEVG